MKILLTSGGTKTRIDSVRHAAADSFKYVDNEDIRSDIVGNDSKGNFGKRIATAALLRGHSVFHLCAEDAPHPFQFTVDLCKPHQDYASRLEELHTFSRKYMSKYQRKTFFTFDDYRYELQHRCIHFEYDVIILCAAVSDYGVDGECLYKISSDKDKLSIDFKKVEKVISKVKQWSPRSKLVGFKLLTGSSLEEKHDAAIKSMADNECDLVFVNDTDDLKETFKHVRIYDPHHMTLLNGTSPAIADSLLQEIEELVQ